jgi:uncharacterized lipoprotein YbaY
MSTISIGGWIQLPSHHEFERAIAIVGLDDVTQIDAPSKRVAEVVIEPISGSINQIPFRLQAEGDLSKRRSYVLRAEIRRSQQVKLRPGDFLTTVAVPWLPGDVDGNAVPVRQV